MEKQKQILILALPVVIIVVGIVILLTLKPDRDAQGVYVGLFETTQIRVSSEIPGRIDSIHVNLGDQVTKGQLLATIESEVLDAKVQQAKGMYSAAESVKNKADKGARDEEILAVKNKWDMAKSQYDYAQKSYDRLFELYRDSLISGQQMDEMIFKRDAAKDQMNAAEALYQMAVEGARAEDRMAAQGQLDAVEGKVKEAEAFYKELLIHAPVSGEVSGKMAEESEVIPAGYPVFTIQKLEEIHAVLYVREDHMSTFQKGETLTGRMPAFDNREMEFEIRYIAPMADFADWTATADKGRLDMKTFEVHIYPKEQVKDLRPGMSVNIFL